MTISTPPLVPLYRVQLDFRTMSYFWAPHTVYLERWRVRRYLRSWAACRVSCSYTNDPERRSQLYPLPPACSAIRDCSLERDPGTKTPPPSPHPCRRSAPHTDDGRRRKRRITNDPERRSQLYPLPPACSAIRVCSLQVLCAVLLVELVVFRPECRVFEP